MGINSPTVVLRGRVGTVPNFRPGTDGKADFVSFRLGVTPSHRDPAGAWVDEATQWYTVKARRSLARHAARSLRKGEPVVVVGELSFEDWLNQNHETQHSAVVQARSIGHDLVYGITTIAKVTDLVPVGPTDVTAPAEVTAHEVEADVDPWSEESPSADLADGPTDGSPVEAEAAALRLAG